MENMKKPAIRFKGFTEAWEQCKLGELGKCQSGIGFPDSEQGGKTGTPFYKVSDMNNSGNEHEMSCANNHVSDAQIVARNWKPVTEVPAIIFAKVGAAIMLNRKRLCRFPFLLDNNTMAYKLGQEWDTDFARTLFEKLDLTTLVQVGALPSYNATDVENMDVKLPACRTEQVQIGLFFRNLDHLITLHQRKYDKLQNMKKACLEKMFPQNGSNVPEIRFKGFTEAWEQRKFEEIVIRSSSISSDDDLPRVEYEDIISGSGHLNKDITSKESDKSGIAFQKGDVLYGKLRPYLKNWLLPSFSGIAVGDFWVLEPLNVSSSFLYRLIQSYQFEEVANQSTGTKMPRADWKLVSKTKFFVPKTTKEQALIGSYFQNLDDLITLHQRELEKLQNIKKSCLEKMFV